MRSKIFFNGAIVFALMLGAVALGHYEWPGAIRSAEGAIPPASQVESDRAGVVRAEGQLVTYPGGKVTVGTEIPGTIKAVFVKEDEPVSKGQLIAEIDSRAERAQLAEARARVAEAQADIDYLTPELDRMRKLFSSSTISRENFERTQRDLVEATAKREEASADADSFATVLDKTRITAPIDGVILKRFVDPGQTVASEANIAVIADVARTRVQAEVDEFDVGHVALGAPALVTIEGYPDRAWRGRVEEIPSDVVARQMRPQDPGSPVDTRVLMVKVALLEPTPIKLDQRVEIEIMPSGAQLENRLSQQASR